MSKKEFTLLGLILFLGFLSLPHMAEGTGMEYAVVRSAPQSLRDSFAVAEVNMEWNQTYGGSASDVAYSVIQTADGGFALTGYTESYGTGHEDVWLVKIDTRGELQWEQTYGGTEGDDDDGAYAVIQTTDGGFALAGYTGWKSDPEYDDAHFGDAWLVKTDARGEEEWTRTYGDSLEDEAHSVIETTDGGFAFAGWTTLSWPGNIVAWLVKTDARGVVEWSQTYGGGSFSSLIQTIDGGFALAGSGTLVKTDVNGNEEWTRIYGSGYFRSIIQTGDGEYALAGTTSASGAGSYDGWLVKTDARGEEEWAQTYGGDDRDYTYSVIQISNGEFVLVGETRSYGVGGYDGWLVKTDASGELQRMQTYGGSQYDVARAVIQTVDGGFALAGRTNSYGVGEADFWLVKIDDYEETSTFYDTDGDGLADDDEVGRYGTDPNSSDTDGDGLNDGYEVEHGINPLNSDTDADGLSDGEEVTEYTTDPLNSDSDGDGLVDKTELDTGTDPLDPLDPNIETVSVPEFPLELGFLVALALAVGVRKLRR